MYIILYVLINSISYFTTNANFPINVNSPKNPNQIPTMDIFECVRICNFYFLTQFTMFSSYIFWGLQYIKACSTLLFSTFSCGQIGFLFWPSLPRMTRWRLFFPSCFLFTSLSFYGSCDYMRLFLMDPVFILPRDKLTPLSRWMDQLCDNNFTCFPYLAEMRFWVLLCGIYYVIFVTFNIGFFDFLNIDMCIFNGFKVTSCCGEHYIYITFKFYSF